MTKRRSFWIAFALLSLLAAGLAYRYFPLAFPIVSLDIAMDREGALDAARRMGGDEGIGPRDAREAASFALDARAQTFVELEGGGKEAFARLMTDGLYAPYTWRVRHFLEGEKHEATFRFTPEGRPYGFVERLREDAPGAVLGEGEARAIGEAAARSAWGVDLPAFVAVEQSEERRPGGRVDHTFVYERPDRRLNEGRFRLRLTVSGDRLTEVAHFIQIPEAFERRYEEMRSANDAIGVASSVGMLVLYLFGGVGVGMFFLLRQRWLLWRRAALWGGVIGLFQLAAGLNEWPLAWMGYDTALSIGGFTAQTVALTLAASVGMTLLLALSFTAAESLGRRAFPSHPQLWKAWSRDAAASPEILGGTMTGYLLVGIFFLYEVALYLLSTRVLGWWTPSEALVHPDVLATYQPWLAAIAPSVQAGFWEEALFRAVPLAGAALIGDRFGGRRPWIIFAMLLQAAIFGAGHAPYPTQPAYARAVELVVPSIGFGLLYLRFGLLPGVVLHYAFDVIWFALPVFVSTGATARTSQALIVLLTLVPLGVVLVARLRAGRWAPLPDSLRNGAWTPPAAAPAEAAPAPAAAPVLLPGLARAVMVAGAAGLLLWLWARPLRSELPPLEIGREVAAAVARDALEARGVALGEEWWVMPMAANARPAGAFVWETAGRERYMALLGSYLEPPHWRVRAARFEGDVAERAEEWVVHVAAGGTVTEVSHTLPEAREGASLSEEAARALARDVVGERFGLAGADLEDVSAEASKRPARMDWDITFADRRVAPLPQGEARVTVTIAGDEVADVRRFVHVPEEWQRRQRAKDTTALIVNGLGAAVIAGLLLAGAIGGVVSWSRRRFAVRFFLVAMLVFLGTSVVDVVNGFPSMLAMMSTAQPWRLQVVMLGGLGLVGVAIVATVLALVSGAAPRWVSRGPALPRARALALGAAAGAFAAGALTVVASLAPADGPVSGSYDAASSYLPALAVALGQVGALVARTATYLLILAGVERLTRGWTKRRALAGAGLVAIGVLLGGGPLDDPAWFVAVGLVAGAILFGVVRYLLRVDASLVPPAAGAMAVLALAREGLYAAFPGAALGAALGIAITLAATWWWFLEARRALEQTS